MTPQERRFIYNKFQGHCAYCGKEIKFKDMQVDHFIARANSRPIGKDLDGHYVYPDINNFKNLMPSCRRCNHYKRAESIETFRTMLKSIHERIKKIYITKVAEDYGIIQYNKWDGIFYFEKINQNDKITNP